MLLTACVNPAGMAQTALQDAGVRLRQYVEAIRFYLDKYPFHILVVENTGVDLSPYFPDSVSEGRIECLTFNGNSFDRSLGKGYGEGLILNYAFTHSVMVGKFDYVMKVSGRHKVLNLNSIMAASEIFLDGNPRLIVCEAIPGKRFARSDCYIASRSFYEQYLNSDLRRCNDSRGVWFEHVLYDSICRACDDGYQFLQMPLALDQQGVSGTSGNEIKRTRMRRKLRFFARMLAYKAGWAALHKPL